MVSFHLNVHPNLVAFLIESISYTVDDFILNYPVKLIPDIQKNTLLWKAIRSLSIGIGMKTRGWCSNGIAKQENLLSAELEARSFLEF